MLNKRIEIYGFGFWFSLLLLFFLGCAQPKLPIEKPGKEFRGVWIATISNIDWPALKDFDPESQKQHFRAILKFYKKLDYNAVIVQVRAAGDAFYPTELAPWSRFLTGAEGQAPEPFYDPLAWMIEAAHLEGMEFHAWMNPFRATSNLKTKSLHPTHVYHQHRSWLVRYGSKYYINPGIEEARNYVQEVVEEVVTKYDIDAIHFDDYFYPYPKPKITFNDKVAFRKRKNKNLNLADWRRSNINTFIENCSKIIRNKKSKVQFGISPFGVWRNQSKDPMGSPTKATQTSYDNLYADVLHWNKSGWLDYVAPQLYWSREYELASYRELIAWWSDHRYRSKLYIGLGVYKVQNNHDQAWDDLQEIPKQIEMTRSNAEVQGYITFSARSLIEGNFELSEMLRYQILEQE